MRTRTRRAGYTDLGILTVKDEIDKQKAYYNEKLSVHSNRLARGLTTQRVDE